MEEAKEKKEGSNLERGAHQRTQDKINAGESQRHDFKKENGQIFLCEVYHSLPLVRGCMEGKEECGLCQTDDREPGGCRRREELVSRSTMAKEESV